MKFWRVLFELTRHNSLERVIVTKPSLHNHLLYYLIIVLLWKKVLIRLVKIHDMDVDILMVLLSG